MRAILSAVVSAVVVLLGGTSHAQEACQPAEVTAGENAIAAPPGFPKLVKAQLRSGSTFTDVNLAGAAADLAVGNFWAAEIVEALRTEARRTGGTPVLIFAADGGRTCFQVVKTDVAEGGNETPLAAGTLDDCKAQASAWEQEILKQVKGGRSPGYTLIVFMESGEICHANRLYGIAGDPIHVGVYTSTTQWAPTRFEPCAIEPAAPAVYVSVDQVNLTPQGRRESGGYTLRKNTPRRCFNSAVDISFRRTEGTTADGAIRYNLSQHQLYRGTLQLGAIFTPQHVREFDVRTVGEENILYSKGPNGRGVEYTASLVLYGAPRYVISLFGGPSYSGRDLVHDDGVLDRLGAVLGIGLTQPGRRFVAGASFEVIYGVNVLYVADILRAPQPVGARLDEPFAGTRDDIRTEERWTTRGVWGISVDLLYVKELFSGRITP